jgi:hypothetical protein
MFTHFDKAWFGPAFGNWLAAGIIGFAEHFFNIPLPTDMKTMVTAVIVGAVVYIVPNKDKPAPVPPAPPVEAPAAPAAPAA